MAPFETELPKFVADPRYHGAFPFFFFFPPLLPNYLFPRHRPLGVKLPHGSPVARSLINSGEAELSFFYFFLSRSCQGPEGTARFV